MVRPHRAKVLALDLVQRLDRNDCSGADGRNDGAAAIPRKLGIGGRQRVSRTEELTTVLFEGRAD
jgi:hypothetical protein